MTNDKFEELKHYVLLNKKDKDYTNGYINALLDYDIILSGEHNILFDMINKS